MAAGGVVFDHEAQREGCGSGRLGLRFRLDCGFGSAVGSPSFVVLLVVRDPDRGEHVGDARVSGQHAREGDLVVVRFVKVGLGEERGVE